MAQVVVLSDKQGQYQNEAILQSAKKYRYPCPRCGMSIPSDVRDGRIGKDHKKCDGQTLCGFQFDVQNGNVETQSSVQGCTYICFEHSMCRSTSKNRHAVTEADAHKKKKQQRVQYRCHACGNRVMRRADAYAPHQPAASQGTIMSPPYIRLRRSSKESWLGVAVRGRG